MHFCFPKKFPTFRKQKSDFERWSVSIHLPIIFSGTEPLFWDTSRVWKIDAPTQIKFEKNDTWHNFKVTFLGFGIDYARQWDY